MRTILTLLFAGFLLNLTAQFDSVFESKTLRIDYQHAGNSDEDFYYLDQVKVEPFWGGSRKNLIDTFSYGQYMLKVFDVVTDQLIYSRGYSTLFGEWQTTEEARSIPKSFSETVVMPLPREKVRIEIYTRNPTGTFDKKFVYTYHPDDYFINPEQNMKMETLDVMISGDPAVKVDIVILPDGYTASEMDQFIADCSTFADVIFQFEPFAGNKDKFNIRAVLAPSEESGNDIPAENIWQKTVLHTHYYTFDSERYCMTRANQVMRDLAANVPYDQIYILVNRDKYGGGGIYNQYCVSAAGNLVSSKIIIHEFGHGFAGLGDEYVGTVSYSDFYPLDVEPWEPNLTTLVDFDSKWGHLIQPGTPIPTPDTEEYYQVIGVFEGGGYTSKGIYRPVHDCLMNTFNGNSFCGVCQEAIHRMIDFYAE